MDDQENELNSQLIIQQLRQRRIHLGLSQRDVDGMLDCSDGLVSKWECGERIPHAGSMSKWADALGCVIHAIPLEAEG